MLDELVKRLEAMHKAAVKRADETEANDSPAADFRVGRASGIGAALMLARAVREEAASRAKKDGEG